MSRITLDVRKLIDQQPVGLAQMLVFGTLWLAFAIDTQITGYPKQKL